METSDWRENMAKREIGIIEAHEGDNWFTDAEYDAASSMVVCLATAEGDILTSDSIHDITNRIKGDASVHDAFVAFAMAIARNM